MSETDVIVEVTAVEASTIVVEVVAPPPAVMVVEVVTPPSVAVIEVEDFGGPPIGYPQLPVALRQLPISFPFSDKPGINIAINVPMGFAVTVPAGLAGTMSYARIKPAANAVFTLNRVVGAVVTLLGTVTLTPDSQTSHVLAGPGGAVAVGEVLQILTGAQDASLADIGITVMANRV